jgi:hypothetical protein
MKRNKFALFISLAVLVLFPIAFLFLSLVTGNWRYLAWSIPSSLAAGLTGMMITFSQMKKEQTYR